MNKQEIYQQILDLIDNLRNYPLSSNEEKTLEQFESQIALILYRLNKKNNSNFSNNSYNFYQNQDENNKVSLARLHNPYSKDTIYEGKDNINETNDNVNDEINIIDNGQDNKEDNSEEIYNLIHSINGDNNMPTLHSSNDIKSNIYDNMLDIDKDDDISEDKSKKDDESRRRSLASETSIEESRELEENSDEFSVKSSLFDKIDEENEIETSDLEEYGINTDNEYNNEEETEEIEEVLEYEEEEKENKKPGLLGFFQKAKIDKNDEKNASQKLPLNDQETQQNQGFEGSRSESDFSQDLTENELNNTDINETIEEDNDYSSTLINEINKLNEDIDYKVSRVENEYHEGDPEPEDVHDIANNTPMILMSDNVDIFKEEYEKDEENFVYQRSHIKIGKDGKDDMMITIFPFDPRKDERNTKILVIAEYDNEYYMASSFENENEGQNMVKMGIEGYEILFQGGMEDGKFIARILPTGNTELIEVDKVVNNPPKMQVGNGHIKFSYDAAEDIQGTIEIFTIKTMMNSNNLILVRRVQDFVDYAFPSDSPFIVRTAQGNKVVNAENDRGRIRATLTDFSY